MKKLFVALIVMVAIVMSVTTVSTASAVELALPNGDVIHDLPDGASNAGSPGQCEPPCGGSGGGTGEF